LANTYMMLGRYDDAIAETEAAARLAPNGVWASAALFMRSIAYFLAGQADRSLELVTASLRVRPHYMPAQIHIAICLTALDHWDQAQSAMRGVQDSNPTASFQLVEQHLRGNLYTGMERARIDAYVAVALRLWDGAPRRAS
jgi:tetratricopeptide (TPR) repeat protein